MWLRDLGQEKPIIPKIKGNVKINKHNMSSGDSYDDLIDRPPCTAVTKRAYAQYKFKGYPIEEIDRMKEAIARKVKSGIIYAPMIYEAILDDELSSGIEIFPRNRKGKRLARSTIYHYVLTVRSEMSHVLETAEEMIMRLHSDGFSNQEIMDNVPQSAEYVSRIMLRLGIKKRGDVVVKTMGK